MTTYKIWNKKNNLFINNANKIKIKKMTLKKNWVK